MRTLLAALRRAPKRTSALIAMIAAAIIVPTALLAWGPDRPTYTIAQPADHVTFDSITDNPNIGDERNFVGIRENGTNNAWTQNQQVEAGKEYIVRMYVHNNAASNLNLVAHNVTAKFDLPTTTGTSIQVNGFLDSSNATPQEVYSHATFTSNSNFNLAYVPGSLHYYNNYFGSQGTPISESVFTSQGALLGYDKLDGNIPGCFQYAGYLTFIVKPQVTQTANFTVTKEVRKAGTTGWNKSVSVNPGDTLEYLVTYQNVGQAVINDATLKDTLPKGISYLPGTTYIYNTANPNGIKVSDNIVAASGLNIGSYNGGGGAYIKYSAQVQGNDQLATCGPNSLVNTARIETAYGWKEDTATVMATKTCTQPNMISVCNLKTKQVETINESSFNSSMYSKNLADCAVIPTTPSTPGVPTTPAELPHTGPADTIMSVIGLGSLVAAGAYYIASRRAL